MRLWQDFQTNSGLTIHKWTHYFPAYERHFSAFVGRPLTFLEIGTGDGGSIQMWKRYFGPYAQLISADIRPECKAFEGDQIQIRIGDQADTAFLQSIIDEFGAPDVVLDDGSHIMEHVCATFHYLYPRLPKHGVYMVEDLHTAYWEQYGGGLRREGTFIELAKRLIDELNADLSLGAIEPTDFTHSTNSIHFYNSIIAIEKGLAFPKTAPLIGTSGHYGRKS
jgi:hypothetical protein